jgi:hypothetical protein
LAHLIELEWLDDCHHQLHVSHPSMVTAAGPLTRVRFSRVNPEPESSLMPTPKKSGKSLG